MAKVNSLKQSLLSCFSEKWIKETAAATGLVQRLSKVDIVAFFWTLVLGFGTGSQRSLAELRRGFHQATGTALAPSSFYDRFTPALCRFLKLTVVQVCATLAEPTTKMEGKLRAFTDLVVADASVISLHELLADKFKACRTNHSKAALKLQMVISVFAAGPRFIQLFSERGKELKKLKVGKWLKGRLLLFDLGYYQFSLFERIARNGGFFISRAKTNANFLVTKVNRKYRGHAVQMVGKKLQDVLPLLKRKTFDVEVELWVGRRAYGGWKTQVPKTFRVVGVLNEETGKYHIYITNIDSPTLSPEDIARTYAARWEVELLFKELKSQYRIDELPSSKQHIVEALIYVAILTMTVSRLLLQAIRKRADLSASRTPVRRWAVSFKTAASVLLILLLDHRANRQRWADLEKFLRHEAKDPNLKRLGNIEALGA
ncbi:MAG: IS4 family transposase [Vulcanimicrobiota bacterium]